MRRLLAPALILVLMAGCTSGKQRDLARYYDPEGLFSTDLPAANTISVTPPQPSGSGPTVLSGVVTQPPQPSPSPQAQSGGLAALGQTAPADQTIYEALAVTTDPLPDLDQMALTFLTGDPSIDVQQEEPITVAGTDGVLVIADSVQQGAPQAGLAVAMTLGDGQTGYVVAAIFPPGEWASEEADFHRVVESFRAGVPPGLRTFPSTQGTS